MSASLVYSISCPVSTIAMTNPAVSKTPSRLCQPSTGENVSDYNGCSFQVDCTSTAVIEELSALFVQFGLPDTIVTDNGTCFVSAEFAAYLRNMGSNRLRPHHTIQRHMVWQNVQYR